MGKQVNKRRFPNCRCWWSVFHVLTHRPSSVSPGRHSSGPQLLLRSHTFCHSFILYISFPYRPSIGPPSSIRIRRKWKFMKTQRSKTSSLARTTMPEANKLQFDQRSLSRLQGVHFCVSSHTRIQNLSLSSSVRWRMCLPCKYSYCQRSFLCLFRQKVFTLLETPSWSTRAPALVFVDVGMCVWLCAFIDS